MLNKDEGSLIRKISGNNFWFTFQIQENHTTLSALLLVFL